MCLDTLFKITKDDMFMWDVLAGWCRINTCETTHVLAKEIIWNNSQIKCNNKILFYHDWYWKGIKLIIEHYMILEFNNFSIQ